MSDSGGFDRLKPRTQSRPRPGFSAPRPDQEGKSALFSSPVTAAAAPLGAITLACSGCLVTTSLTPWRAMLAAVPSLHLPIVRKSYPSWMRCPACRKRTWVRVAVRLP